MSFPDKTEPETMMNPNSLMLDRKSRLKDKYKKIAPIYHEARYEDAVGNFHLEQTNRMILQLLSQLGYTDLTTSKILDVATGSGRNLDLFSDSCEKIIGLDYVFEMLKQAREKQKMPSFVPLVQGDAESLPFGNQSFDLVVSCRFLHLITNELKKACLKEFSRVLKPNGIIIVEFVNACYFMNPRTLLRTIVKSIFQKGYFSQKIIPFGWGLQFNFLEKKAIAGTWYPGFQTLIRWFPHWRHRLEQLLLIPPFNIFSERILLAFTLKRNTLLSEHPTLWTRKENLFLIVQRPKGQVPLVVKKVRSFRLRNLIQFFKDRNLLKSLQHCQSQHFRILKLHSSSFFDYVTEYEKLQPIASHQDIENLSETSREVVLNALSEFQQIVRRLPVTLIDRLDDAFYQLELLKRLIVLMLKRKISLRDSWRTILLYYKCCLIRSDEFKAAVHGDILSGGNLSLSPKDEKVLFLDFENVRKNEFFLYDLVHVACKNPVHRIFKSAWVGQWFSTYLKRYPIEWTQTRNRNFLRQLQYCFIQALLRRLHERMKTAPSNERDIRIVQENLKSCFDAEGLSQWLTAISQEISKPKQMSMGNLKRTVVGQYIHSFFSRLLMIGMKAFIIFFLVYRLDEKDYGFYGLVTASLGIWVAFSDLGWGDYLRREIPVMSEASQKVAFKNAVVFQLFWMGILTFVAVALWKGGFLYKLQDFEMTKGLPIVLPVLFFLSGLFPIIQIYLNYSKSIEEFNNLILLQVASWILLMLGGMGLLGDISLPFILWTWAASLIFIHVYFFLRRKILIFGPLNLSFLKKSVTYGFPLSLTETSKRFFQYYDRYLLGTFASLSAVAPYHFFNTLFDFSEKVNQITLYPYIYQAHDEKYLSRRNRLITSLLKTRILFQVLSILFFSLVIYFVPNVLPATYIAQIRLFLFVGCTSLVRHLSLISQLGLTLERKSKILALSYIIGIVVSLPLNFWLIPRFAAYGAATSLLLSTIVTILVQCCFIRVWEYLDFSHLFSWKQEWESALLWWDSFIEGDKMAEGTASSLAGRRISTSLR